MQLGRIAAVTAVMGAACAWTTAASAQGAGSTTADTAIEEIVVTAQRREQGVQRVPISITALDGDAIVAAGLASTQDLGQRTPGLVMNSTGGAFGQPYLRGIGNDLIQPGSDSSVAVFVEGIFQPRAYGALNDFFDAERVEVLKGPQGTLFGRNAAGGAINLYSRAPQQDWAASAALAVGNYDRARFRGTINAPVGENSALRLAGTYGRRDGYTRNDRLGRRTDDEDTWSARLQFRTEPTDATSLLIGMERMEDDGTRNMGFKIVEELPQPQRDFAGAAGLPPPRVIADPRAVLSDRDNRQRVRHTRAWGRGEWEGPAFTLTSLTGYSDAEYAVAADLDVTESDWATQLSEDASESWSQELQIVSPRADSRWSWVTGLYYYHESASQELNGLLPPFAFALQWRSSIDTDAYAVFGQSTYSATERLRLTVGLRYSYEEKSATFRQAINGAVTAAVPEENYRAWTPRIALEYDVVDDVLLYASGSRGFKSGGFNLNNAGEEFGPELVWSYEIGVKSTLRDGRLRLNAAAFHMDYEDLQVSQFVGFAAFVRNAASAKIRGLETEIVALPLEALRIEATIGYLDAEYRDYDTGTPAGNLAGMRLPRAPEWQATGAVEWNIGRIGAGAFAIRADASHQSRVFFSPDNVRFQDDPARTLLNARLRFTSSDGRWMLAAYGQNLTDETYNLGVQRADAFFGSFRILGAPRTYGLEAELRF